MLRRRTASSLLLGLALAAGCDSGGKSSGSLDFKHETIRRLDAGIEAQPVSSAPPQPPSHSSRAPQRPPPAIDAGTPDAHRSNVTNQAPKH